MEALEYQTMYQVEDTHFWYRAMRRIIAILLDKYIVKKAGNMILDAGCGTGRNILFLRQYGVVKGIDISPQAVQFCRKRRLKNVRIGSIDQIPFLSNSFDIVTCFDVLGQNEVLNDVAGMQEFYRVLKPGGILLVRVAAYTWLSGYHDTAVHTKRRYEEKDLCRLFNKTNFRQERITYANTFFFPMIAILRIFRRIIPKRCNKNSDVLQKVSPFFNKILYYPLWVESKIIRHISMPYGLSLIGVAKKLI